MKPVAAAFEVTPPVLPSNAKLELFGIVAGELATPRREQRFSSGFRACPGRVRAQCWPTNPRICTRICSEKSAAEPTSSAKPTLLSSFLAVALGAHRNMEVGWPSSTAWMCKRLPWPTSVPNAAVRTCSVNSINAARNGPKPPGHNGTSSLQAVRPRGAMGLVRRRGFDISRSGCCKCGLGDCDADVSASPLFEGHLASAKCHIHFELFVIALN